MIPKIHAAVFGRQACYFNQWNHNREFPNPFLFLYLHEITEPTEARFNALYYPSNFKGGGQLFPAFNITPVIALRKDLLPRLLDAFKGQGN